MLNGLELRQSPKGLSKGMNIVDQIRSQIVSGQLAPGTRLPTYDQMEELFSVSRVTLREAVRRLKRHGFVYSAGRRGTFVCERPPHLYRYGLVFPPDSHTHHQFWMILANEASKMQHQLGREVVTYHHVDAHMDNEVYQQLCREVRGHRLAGLIFPDYPEDLVDSPLFADESFPRVVISHVPLAGARLVCPDDRSFLDKALDWLAGQGRKRIAVVSMAQHRMFDAYPKAIADRGMSMEPYWLLSVGKDHPEGVRNLVHLLMSGPTDRRPDGLIIADDSFAEHAIGGLIASRVRVPDELDVVCHCNWPCPVPSVLPVRRLGYDSRHILKLCIDTIDALRRKKEVEAIQTSPALFEEELDEFSY